VWVDATKQAADEILIAGSACPARPLPPAPLRTIGRQRHPLDVAGMGDRDHHVPRGWIRSSSSTLAFLLDDDGSWRGGCELRLHVGEFGLDDGLDAGRAANAGCRGNSAIFDGELVEFLGKFPRARSAVSRCSRRSRMALACSIDKPRGAVFSETMPRIVDQA